MNNFSLMVRMFWCFFRIGAFTIGGGLAMLPLIEKEVVDNQKWIPREEIVDVFAISQSVPGVIAINSSIFIGYKVMKLRGAIVSAFGVILPSFLIIIPIAYLMFNVQGNVYVDKALTGVRAGVTALIALTAIRLGKSVLKDVTGILLAVISFFAILLLDVHAFLAIAAGAVAGLMIYGIKRREKQ